MYRSLIPVSGGKMNDFVLCCPSFQRISSLLCTESGYSIKGKDKFLLVELNKSEVVELNNR